MEIVDHALHAVVDEVIVPHSGWERGSNGGEESCKPRHLEWEIALTNSAGCLRYLNDQLLNDKDPMDEESIMLRCLIVGLTFPFPQKECEFRT